jgi:hypothetical protein
MPRFLEATTRGVHPSKLFPLTWALLAFAFEPRTVLPTGCYTRPQPIPACHFVACCGRIAPPASLPVWLSGFAPSESPSTARGCYAIHGPLLPWGLPLWGFLSSRSGPAFAGLPLPDLYRRPCGRLRTVPQWFALREDQLALAAFKIAPEPLLPGCYPL